MSHSVPSDSSPVESTFLVGTDLVSFDRRDLPIYATPQSLWADAGHDTTFFGASVDRLYGEPGETFVANLPLLEEPRDVIASLPAIDDPMVVLAGLSDGLILPTCEHQPAVDLAEHALPTHDSATLYDFASDSHLLLPHDSLGWDLAKPEWFYDHHV